ARRADAVASTDPSRSEESRGCPTSTLRVRTATPILLSKQESSLMLTSRPFVIALATMASSACFDPMVDPVGSGSETDGSTTDPSASSTLDTDSAEGPLDSTGSLDAPPEITAFTINGSTMPAEQQLAGLIELDITYTHSGDLV